MDSNNKILQKILFFLYNREYSLQKHKIVSRLLLDKQIKISVRSFKY